MNEISLHGKVLAPTLHPVVLRREALISTLVNAFLPTAADQTPLYKLVLLCAPAGYGKTTLLTTAIQQADLPCCWCLLDKGDTHPLLFLQLLLASFRHCFPTFGTHLDQAFLETNENATLTDCKRLVNALLDALNTEVSQRFLLTFCNYQEVNNNQTINTLLNCLLDRLPGCGTIVIESRSMPHLELARCIARRQFFGLGSHKLRFSAQEIYELANLQGTALTYLEAEQIVTFFEGWITGILLGSLLGYSHLPGGTPIPSGATAGPGLRADYRQLLRYIKDEVFAQEARTYKFLQETSVFSQLTPAYCNALLQRDDTQQQLLYGEQQGLFLTRSAADHVSMNTFHCHPALQTLFREELQRHSPEHYLALQLRAAHILLDAQEYEQALDHTLLAQEYTLAASILLDIAPAHLARKQETKVVSWLERFPRLFVEQNLRLLLVLATVHWLNGEYQQMPPLLNTIETLLQAEDGLDQATRSLAQAELAIVRGNLLFSQGEFQCAQESCHQALALLPADQRHLLIRAHQCLGLCLIAGTGQISQGIIQLQQALQLSSPQQERAQTAVLHRQLGSAYSWLGSYILAEHHLKRAQHIWEQLGSPRGLINSLTCMGHLKGHQGFIHDARESFTTALHLARNVHHFSSGEAYALLGLGELSCREVQYAQALVLLEDSLKLGLQLKDAYLINCSHCALATTYTLMGDIQTAQFFLDQVEIGGKCEQSFEGVYHCLTQGYLLLAQKANGQTQSVLERAVALAKQSNIQFFAISASLTLAVCYLRQGKPDEARQAVGLTLELNQQGDHDARIQIEVKRYPELQTVLGHISSSEQARGMEEVFIPVDTIQKARPTQEERVLSPLYQGAPHLHIIALGEPAVFVDGSPITHWRMARAMELYFFLLENNRLVRKDQIQLALWPDADAERIEQTVRSTIYYLRQAIGKDCLLGSSGVYSLNLAALYGKEIWYDVALFDRRYSEAKANLEKEEDERAVVAFTEVIDLYKGDYLQPFYGDWCVFRRDQLRRAYIDARHQLAMLTWHAEDIEESLNQWQHLLALDPCFEKAHAGIMRYYLRKGQRELALRQFQRCCVSLQEELQTTPGPSLQKLYQRIQASSTPF